MFRVGIVGYGFAGRGLHAPLIDRVSDFKLVAVASRDAERRARAKADRSVETFVTLDELLERGNVDLVVIATPHDTHASLACRAMAAGKHVVVDKVMCLNGAEADAMIAARDRNRVMLSVFQNRRWDGDYLTVKKVIAEGLIGSPYLFELTSLRYRTARGWRNTASASGGVLFDWGAHFVDQALQLVPGTVSSVTCDVQHRSWGADAGSYGRLLLRFSIDVLFSIEVGYLAQIVKPHWVVLGERGSFVKYGVDPQEAALLRGNIDAAVEDPAEKARIKTDVGGLQADLTVEGVRGNWSAYYENVADALAGRAELAVTAEQVNRAIRVFDAATLAASNGNTVVGEF